MVLENYDLKINITKHQFAIAINGKYTFKFQSNGSFSAHALTCFDKKLVNVSVR